MIRLGRLAQGQVLEQLVHLSVAHLVLAESPPSASPTLIAQLHVLLCDQVHLLLGSRDLKGEIRGSEKSHYLAFLNTCSWKSGRLDMYQYLREKMKGNWQKIFWKVGTSTQLSLLRSSSHSRHGATFGQEIQQPGSRVGCDVRENSDQLEYSGHHCICPSPYLMQKIFRYNAYCSTSTSQVLCDF